MLRTKLVTALSLLALSLGLAACGPDNQTACQEACAEVNMLECTAEDFLDCENQCPEAWNDTGLDFTDYIDCTFSQYDCDENGDYVFTQQNCTIPM